MGEVIPKTARIGRPKRRNFEAELRDLQRYCEISIQVMEAIVAGVDTQDGRTTPYGLVPTHIEGQIAALKAVRARLEPQS